MKKWLSGKFMILIAHSATLHILYIFWHTSNSININRVILTFRPDPSLIKFSGNAPIVFSGRWITVLKRNKGGENTKWGFVGLNNVVIKSELLSFLTEHFTLWPLTLNYCQNRKKKLRLDKGWDGHRFYKPHWWNVTISSMGMSWAWIVHELFWFIQPFSP